MKQGRGGEGRGVEQGEGEEQACSSPTHLRDVVVVGDKREHGDAKHCIDEHNEGEDAADVDKRRKGENHADDQVAKVLGTLEQPEDAQDTEDTKHAQQHRRDGQVLREELGGKLIEQRGADEKEVEAAPRVAKVASAPMGASDGWGLSMRGACEEHGVRSMV